MLQVKKSVVILFLRGIYWGITGSVIAYSVKVLSESLLTKDWQKFLLYFGIIAFVYFLKSIPGYIVRKNQSIYSNTIQSYLYASYLEKFLFISGESAEKLGTGLANNIIQKGLDNRTRILERVPQNRVELSIGMVCSFTLIFSQVGWKVSGGMIVLLIGIRLFAQRANNHVIQYRKAKRDLYGQGDRQVVKVIMTKQEILQSGNILSEIQKNTSIMDNILREWIKEQFYFALAFDGQRGVVDIIRLGLVFFVGYGVIQGTYTVGDFAMIWMLGSQINEHISNLNDYITAYHQQIVYVQKLRDTFDHTPRMIGYDTGKDFIHTQGDLSFQHINFGYGDALVLKDFCLEIKGGKKTALVGLSGSGKTTIMKLIAGYLRPLSGTILIDGQDLTLVSLQSYYRHIGYLTQEPSIFDGTVRENLGYGVESIKSKVESNHIDRIIKLAKCEFMYDFPEGLETEIGEKGIRLSGGQRQRLAIAKIFLKNPEIILLDEPTSALDSFSEEAVTEAMHNLFEGRTVIIIAHRLQTVKHADEIIVLGKRSETGEKRFEYQRNQDSESLQDGAEILERGNHKELVNKGGVYAQMVEMQSGF